VLDRAGNYDASRRGDLIGRLHSLPPPSRTSRLTVCAETSGSHGLPRGSLLQFRFDWLPGCAGGAQGLLARLRRRLDRFRGRSRHPIRFPLRDVPVPYPHRQRPGAGYNGVPDNSWQRVFDLLRSKEALCRQRPHSIARASSTCAGQSWSDPHFRIKNIRYRLPTDSPRCWPRGRYSTESRYAGIISSRDADAFPLSNTC